MWNRSTKSKSRNILRHAVRVSLSSMYISSNLKSWSWKCADDGTLKLCQNRKYMINGLKFNGLKIITDIYCEAENIPSISARPPMTPMHGNSVLLKWRFVLPSLSQPFHTWRSDKSSRMFEIDPRYTSTLTCAYYEFPSRRRSRKPRQNFRRSSWKVDRQIYWSAEWRRLSDRTNSWWPYKESYDA